MPRFSLPHLELGKRKPSRQGSTDSAGSASSGDGVAGSQVVGTPREEKRAGDSPHLPSGPGSSSSSDSIGASPSSGEEDKPRRRSMVTRVFRPFGGKKRMKAQVPRTPSAEGVGQVSAAAARDAPTRLSIDNQLSGRESTAAKAAPVAPDEAGRPSVSNDLASNITVRQQPSAMPAVPPPLPIKSMSVESTGQLAEAGETDDAPLTPGGIQATQGTAGGELVASELALVEPELARKPTMDSKASSRDSIFSLLLGSVSGFFGGGKSESGLSLGQSSEALPRLGSDDESILAARDQMMMKNMSTSSGIVLEDGEYQDVMSSLHKMPSGGSHGSLPLSDSAIGDSTGAAAARTEAYAREAKGTTEADDEAESLMGTDADLCSIIDLAQLEEIVWDASFAGSELAPLGQGDDVYNLNYATQPPGRGISGEVVSDLATMLTHGGSSMDVLRHELALPSPSDLAKGPRPTAAASKKASKKKTPPPGPEALPAAGGLAGLAAGFTLLPSWTSGASAADGGTDVSSGVGSSSPSASLSSSGDMAPPKAKKTVSTASSASDSSKAGSRNTLGRKEWSAEEDAIIMAEVEKNGQKWRVIAAQLPGRSDDAVRNRWKRLSAEAASQASAVADALGIPLPSVVEGGEGGSGEAAAPKAPKVKAERLAWTKAEDAEIIRCVQSYGLKWGRISQNLPGRTAHAIRNRFHRLQQLQQEQAQATGNVLPQPGPITLEG